VLSRGVRLKSVPVLLNVTLVADEANVCVCNKALHVLAYDKTIIRLL